MTGTVTTFCLFVLLVNVGEQWEGRAALFCAIRMDGKEHLSSNGEKYSALA